MILSLKGLQKHCSIRASPLYIKGERGRGREGDRASKRKRVHLNRLRVLHAGLPKIKIPMESRTIVWYRCTLLYDLSAEEFSTFSAAYGSHNAAYLVPPGHDYYWVDRGSLECKVLLDTSTHEQLAVRIESQTWCVIIPMKVTT